ncbi:hypothetical protein D3C81_1913730 [compost metagenome]
MQRAVNADRHGRAALFGGRHLQRLGLDAFAQLLFDEQSKQYGQTDEQNHEQFGPVRVEAFHPRILPRADLPWPALDLQVHCPCHSGS